MIKAVIFDLDGVIVDSMQTHWEAEKRTLQKYGILVTSKELDEYSGKSILFKFSELLKRYELSVKPEEVLEFHMTEGYEYIKANIKPVKGVIELIKHVHKHNVKLGLASGSPLAFILYVLEKFNVLQLFDSIISVDDITHGKPHPEIFLKSAEALGVKPSECIVMEDAPQGIEAAKRAGMKCFAVTTTFPEEKLVNADKIAESFEGLTIGQLNELLGK